MACLGWFQSGYKETQGHNFLPVLPFSLVLSPPTLRSLVNSWLLLAARQCIFERSRFRFLSVARAPLFSTTSRPALGPKRHPVQLVALFPREQSGRNLTLNCHLRLRMTAAILLCRYVRGMDRDGCTFRLYRRRSAVG